METVAFQSFVFSYTVYGGILIGIFYDLYRVIKGRKRNAGLITSLWDIVFLLATLFVIVWAIFSSNYGDLRAYVFIGFTVGFFLYEKILGRIAIAVFLFLKTSFVRFIRTTNSLLFKPFLFIFNLLLYLLSGFMRFVRPKKIRLNKIKRMPKILIEDSKKYYRLIIKNPFRLNQFRTRQIKKKP